MGLGGLYLCSNRVRAHFRYKAWSSCVWYCRLERGAGGSAVGRPGGSSIRSVWLSVVRGAPGEGTEKTLWVPLGIARRVLGSKMAGGGDGVDLIGGADWMACCVLQCLPGNERVTLLRGYHHLIPSYQQEYSLDGSLLMSIDRSIDRSLWHQDCFCVSVVAANDVVFSCHTSMIHMTIAFDE